MGDKLASGGNWRRSAGHEIGSRLGRWLRLQFFLILLMLAGVSVFAFVVFHTLVSGQDRGAALLNLAGRQRMLIQSAAEQSTRMVIGANPAVRAAARVNLRDMAQEMNNFQHNTDFTIVGRRARKQIDEILFMPPHLLYQQMHEFDDAVTALSQLPDDLLVPDQPLLLKVQRMADGPLRDGTEALASVLADGMRKRVNDLHVFALVGEGAFLMLLVLMSWKVFRPLLRHTRTSVAQLAALEDYHRSVVDALADGILVIDPNQRRVEAINPAAQEIFNGAEHAVVGQRLEVLIPATANQSLAQLRRWHRREVEGYAGDGPAFYLEVTMREAPVEGMDRLIAVVRDVTKQVEAEERVHTLNHALEQSAASVFITDIDGVIVYANPRGCEISGYERNELLGQTPRIMRSGLTPAAVYEEMWGRLRIGQGWRGEMLNRKKSGELYWAMLVISPLRNSRGEIIQYMSVMEDITERKLMEEALMVAKLQAERASRTKSDFLASMSHELRTPLNAIIGYSEFIDTEPFGPLGHSRYKEYIGHIQESGRHLLELINDMLDLSKVEAGKLVLEEEEVDLAHSIQGAMHLVLERANRRQVRLSAEVQPDLPCVWADNLRLKQIMLNLLTNAIKFTPEGGDVTLRALRAADGSVKIVVTDTGIGIATDDIAKVLEPFGQVANPMVRREEGTGLGLPITKRLVELHGGGILIESEVGRGTTVTVTLPADRARAAATATVEA